MNMRMTQLVLALVTAVIALPALAGNTVSGSCTDLANHIASPGVEDAEGSFHATKAAWTTVHFSFVTVPTKPKGPVNIKAEVPKPADCLTTTVRGVFRANAAVSAISWIPKAGCDQCKCEQKAGSWNNEAKNQDAYVELAKHLAAQASTRWRSRTFSYCGPIAGAQGRAILGGRVHAAAAAEARALEEAYDVQRDDIDDQGSGDAPPINCGTDCGNCPVGKLPQMCANPGNKCEFGQCIEQVCCFVHQGPEGIGQGTNTYSWMSVEACAAFNMQAGSRSNIAPNVNCAGKPP